jgi:hypothetical protein
MPDETAIATIHDCIPQELIQRAKRCGACSEAIEWLVLKPPTWLDLSVKNAFWCDWAVARLAKSTAWKPYIEARVTALMIAMKGVLNAR